MIDHTNPATWPVWMKSDTRLVGKLGDLDEPTPDTKEN